MPLLLPVSCGAGSRGQAYGSGGKFRRRREKSRLATRALRDRTIAWPIRERLPVSPALLSKFVRTYGRVPLERSRPKGWLVRIRHRTRLAFLTMRTAPKAAFAVSSWRYDSEAAMDDDDADYLGGFVLRVRVHPNENRRHLVRSLGAAKASDQQRRLVVVASAVDLMNANSWVRCLQVNTYSVKLPKSSIGDVELRAARPVRPASPTAYRCTRWIQSVVATLRDGGVRWDGSWDGW